MKSSKLIDIYTNQHPTNKDTPTINSHLTGTAQIDYILGSQKVAENTVRAGILAFHQLLETDHRAMFADIDMLAILHSERTTIYENPTRHLNGHDPALILLYRYELFKHLNDHNIWDQHEAIKKLGAAKSLTTTQRKQLEKAINGLDEDLTRGMLHAEKQLSKTTATYLFPPH